MRPLIFVLMASTGLLACNGGSDSDTPTPASADPAPTSANTDSNANNSAAETANAVRETVAAFERSAPAGTSDALTVRPSSARDPGPRPGNGSAGAALPGSDATATDGFNAGKVDFEEAEEVDEGLGPTMNLDGCGGCHSQPAIGGTSPAVNPQVAFASKHGADQPRCRPFITRRTGRCARRASCRNPDGTPDGGVHALFTITGRRRRARAATSRSRISRARSRTAT